MRITEKSRAGGGPRPFELQPMRRWRSPEALLLPIGEALAYFVCTEDFSGLKTCEGPACTLMFTDRTRGHRRRWCSMAICGNRAKQTAHRHRLKGHKQPAGNSVNTVVGVPGYAGAEDI